MCHAPYSYCRKKAFDEKQSSGAGGSRLAALPPESPRKFSMVFFAILGDLKQVQFTWPNTYRPEPSVFCMHRDFLSQKLSLATLLKRVFALRDTL